MSLDEWIETVIFMGFMLAWCLSLFDVYNEPFYFFPTHLYKSTKMNIFGCIICSILLFTINYLYCTIVTIGWAIYKITHIGRRK